MKKSGIIQGALLVLAIAGLTQGLLGGARPVFPGQAAASQGAGPAVLEDLDRLLAPIALYPDALLAQMLLCAVNPGDVDSLNLWMGKNTKLKGTELQDAAAKAGFEPSFVALALFPQVVTMMVDQLDWTTRLGQAFTSNRSAVFDSIQRLRAQAREVGTLKTTPQQEVQTQTTSSGQQVIVIESANPQIVYVPQYNVQTVYTQAPPTTVVVQQTSSADAVAAGLIGFTAGIAIGAAVNNSHYYGPYGWHGGGYMYNDAWDDYYDAREDAREDWRDNREDLAEERSDRARTQQEQRTDRQENRLENRPESQAQHDERRTQAQQSRSTTSPSAESRGYSRGQDQAVRERGAASSDAFSGYSSGRSERSASTRGQTSRSSSRASRGGGGRRR